MRLKQLEARTWAPADDLTEARKLWAQHRGQNGSAPIVAPLLTAPEGNWKINKGSVATYSLSLAPARTAGVNVCPASTAGCRAGCVAHAGRGKMPHVHTGRANRTTFLMARPEAFLALLRDEIEKAILKHDGKVAFRLNAFSDIKWERVAPWLFDYPVSFYDYTKRTDRQPPDNYHLTFSASEATDVFDVVELLDQGVNVAVVYAVDKNSPLPSKMAGFPVVDGDETDERFRDPKGGVVVGLRAKGDLRGADPSRNAFVKSPRFGSQIVRGGGV